MNAAWKFSIDFAANPEFSKEEIRHMVDATADEMTGRVIVNGDDIYLTKFDDAFSFRLRVGDLVSDMQTARVA